MESELTAACERILSVLRSHEALTPETGLSAIEVRQTLGLTQERFSAATETLNRRGLISLCLDFICLATTEPEALAA
jgi:hypothetical protein